MRTARTLANRPGRYNPRAARAARRVSAGRAQQEEEHPVQPRGPGALVVDGALDLLVVQVARPPASRAPSRASRRARASSSHSRSPGVRRALGRADVEPDARAGPRADRRRARATMSRSRPPRGRRDAAHQPEEVGTLAAPGRARRAPPARSPPGPCPRGRAACGRCCPRTASAPRPGSARRPRPVPRRAGRRGRSVYSAMRSGVLSTATRMQGAQPSGADQAVRRSRPRPTRCP